MRRWLSSPNAAPLAVGVLLSAIVCWPMVTGGPLLLLDWVVGGRTPVIPRTAYGLDGGQLAQAPLIIGTNALSSVIGDAATWIPYVAFFPLAAWSITRVAGSSTPGRVAASLLFSANPFVFDRIATGQINVLLGYALVPWGLSLLLRPVTGWRWAANVTVAWTMMMSASIHYAWIYAVVTGITVALLPSWRRFVWTGAAAAGAALLNAYLYIGTGGGQGVVRIGTADLTAYRSRSDAHVGLLGNLLGLYGFWRRGPQLPKEVDPGWLILLLILLAVVVLGAMVGCRDPARRPTAIIAAVIGLAGLTLAAGDQGPTGEIFRFVFQHVAAFQIMREPQKFLGLLALAYAVLFALGVEAVFARVDSWPRMATGGLAVALPLLYTPTIADGLSRQVRTSHIPATYARAADLVSHRSGQVLVLPWHQYLAFPFTHGVIFNPGVRTFGAAITGDNVELPGLPTDSVSPRSAYIEAALSLGRTNTTFGATVAPLGVDYVVLFKTVDFESYSWLAEQKDLTVVFDTPQIEVLRNTSPTLGASAGHDVEPGVSVLEAASTTSPLPVGTVPLADVVSDPPSPAADVTVTRRSSTRYRITTHGPAGIALLPEPWVPGWRASGGARVVRTSWGTLAVLTRSRTTDLRFSREPLVRAVMLADLFGVITLVAALNLAGFFGRRRRTTST